MKKIAVLGSTGKVGRMVLQFADALGVKVVGLAANRSLDLMKLQVAKFSPEVVSMFDTKSAVQLGNSISLNVGTGMEGLVEVAICNVDILFVCMDGTKSILPVVKALSKGIDVAFANKEVLVAAGEYISNLSKEKGVRLIPLDSEHSAIYQCLLGERKEDIKRLILTASGGPFFNKKVEDLENVSFEDTLKHPTWKMGDKVAVNCSTFMNKGLEVISAKWLFDIDFNKIEVMVHPQSIVHSCVEFVDGTVKAQLGYPDMGIHIGYALTSPQRVSVGNSNFDFFQNPRLDFFKYDKKKFPCLNLAYEVLKKGGTYPCFLNAANEVIVERFCKGELRWVSIFNKLEHLVSKHSSSNVDLSAILEVDKEARSMARVC